MEARVARKRVTRGRVAGGRAAREKLGGKPWAGSCPV